MSSSSTVGGENKKKREQYTQISLFQAFNGRLGRPPTASSGAQPSSTSSSGAQRSSSGAHRNTTGGTSSRYFNNDSRPKKSREEKKDAPRTRKVEREPSSLITDDDQMEDVRYEKSDDEVSKSARKARVGRPRETDPTKGRYHNESYAKVASENIEISKVLLSYLFPTPDQKPDGYLYDSKDCSKLGSKYCPSYPPCTIRIVNADTLDVACDMLKRHKTEQANASKMTNEGGGGGGGGEFVDHGPVLLNLANQFTRGGGWRKGTMAQEEELCYRSTLHASLPRKFYPLSDTEGVYSPFVAVIRSRCTDDHQLYPMAGFIYETATSDPSKIITRNPPKDELPVVSVITIAAIRDPGLQEVDGEERYRSASDRFLMKTKIRLMLRMAALNGHRRVVLGALGCGAFHNPKEEVVGLFKSVLEGEEEFMGGWWKEVVFAVLDTERETEMKGKDGMGNFGVFWRGLEGVKV